MKTGEYLVPPAHYQGEYAIGFDLRTRKRIDAATAKNFVFPNVPSPLPPGPVVAP